MTFISGRTLTLARKELASAYNGPSTYGVIVFFLLFTSIWLFYVQRFLAMDAATLRPYFAAFPVAITLVVPALTMRSWAEERKAGTDELLLTMPFSEWELVLGKFLSSYAVLLTALLLTLPVPLSLAPLGRFDFGVVFAEYLGSALLGAAACALGQLCSSLARNQMGAFLGGFAVLLSVTLVHQVSASLNLPPVLSEFINYLSLAFHFESFAKGVVDTRDAGYFLSVAAGFLFLTTRVILYRKWR